MKDERLCRSITYKIGSESASQKVSSFLKSKGYSTQNRINLKKDPRSIWVNGVCVFQNTILQAGDELKVQIREQENSDGIVSVELPLDIVYEDEDLLVINKPAGMPIHPSLHNYDNSLGNALAWYFKKQGKPFVFRCINRLDRDTSGLTLVAKHMVSGAILSHMVAAKSKEGLEAEGIHREYLAIVEGHVSPEKGVIEAPIARKESSCLERIVDFENVLLHRKQKPHEHWIFQHSCGFFSSCASRSRTYDGGVKVPCLTAWRWRIIVIFLFFESSGSLIGHSITTHILLFIRLTL